MCGTHERYCSAVVDNPLGGVHKCDCGLVDAMIAELQAEGYTVVEEQTSAPITDWGPEHGESLEKWGKAALKKPNPVFLFKPPVAGQVRTNEGTLNYSKGDFIAYDPISGHVWPVAASYVEQHYDFLATAEDVFKSATYDEGQGVFE